MPPRDLLHAGRRVRILADAASTRGRETVLEIEAPFGTGLPRHLHREEDELLWVHDGRLTVAIDREVRELGPGEELLLPRGVPHEVSVATPSARYVVVCHPGGLERFLRATAREDGSFDPSDDDVAAHLAAAGIRVLASAPART